MTTINAYSIQLVTTLLDGTSTVLPSPGSAETGAVVEAHGGLPMRVAGATTNLNVKLGTLTDPKWLAVFGAKGISFKTTETGSHINANPFAFVSDTDGELGISEVWITNSEPDEKSVTIISVE